LAEWGRASLDLEFEATDLVIGAVNNMGDQRREVEEILRYLSD